DAAPVHIGESNVEAMPPGIPTQCIEPVEPHRLVVEERDVVLDRVVALEPSGLVREEPERGGVGFREPEFRKCDYLLEDSTGDRFRNVSRRRACPELLSESLHKLAASPSAHGGAQRFGLGGAGSCHRFAYLEYRIVG